MKRLLLATTAVVALTAGPAAAADMPLKAGPIKSCAADAFRGAYAGVHGGGVNWTANRTDQDDLIFTFGGTQVQKKWGGLAGGQIGYNWTTCNTVWGIEVDGSWASANVKTFNVPNLIGPGNELSVNSRFDGLVTGRVRTGIVMDNLLLYATGGVAAVHSRTTWTQIFAPPGPSAAQAQIQDWRWGMAAGFGTEWAWSDRVSIRSEVLYVDLPDNEKSVNIVPTVGPPFNPSRFNFTRSDSMWISRIGLNVKFGGS